MSTSPHPLNHTARPRGTPVWVVMAILVGLALLFGGLSGGFWYYHARAKARLRAQIDALTLKQAEDELKRVKALDEARLTGARNRQAEVIAQCQSATNVLVRLLAQTEQTLAEALALKSGEPGRALASDPDSVAAARRLYDTELGNLAPVSEISSRLDGVRRLEQQLKDSTGTAYMPEPAAAATAASATLWAEQQLRQLIQVQNLVSTLTREANTKVGALTLPPSSPTLEQAIRQLGQQEAAARQQLLAAKTAEAKAEALQKEAAIEKEAIIQAATAKAEKALAQLQADREKMMADIAAFREKQMADIEKERAKLADEKAKTEEDLRVARAKAQQETEARRARMKIDDAEHQAELEQARLEAEKVALRQKASDSKLRAELAPFITPGYWTPKGYTMDKKPLSYEMLLGEGALDETERGLSKLAKIGMAVDDKLRPRWNLAGGPLAWYKVPASLQKVRQAQKYLVELGPIMVELGMLAK